jgi:RNA polymerase sigma-70 factor, ECF subfamily
MATGVQFVLQGNAPIGCDIEESELEDGLSTFLSLRPRLFGIACRILGSAAEAEDILQEVWLRWQFANRRAVENPPAFLATTTTRLCLNVLGSAYVRRETCVATWAPEPVDTSNDPSRPAEHAEAWKVAVQVLFKKLSAVERAAFVMREAFDCPYRQIADILKLQEANARQLVSRARKHIANSRQESPSAGRRRLANAVTRNKETEATPPMRQHAAPSVEPSTEMPRLDVFTHLGEPGPCPLSFDVAC